MGGKCTKVKVRASPAERAEERSMAAHPAAGSHNETLAEPVPGKLSDSEEKYLELQHVDPVKDPRTRASRVTFQSESSESQELKQQESRGAGAVFQGNVSGETQKPPNLPYQEGTDVKQKQVFISRPRSPNVVREGISSRSLMENLREHQAGTPGCLGSEKFCQCYFKDY